MHARYKNKITNVLGVYQFDLVKLGKPLGSSHPDMAHPRAYPHIPQCNRK